VKTFLHSRAFNPEVFDDVFVNKLVLSTVEVHHKVTGLFHKGLDTFLYDFDLRHQASTGCRFPALAGDDLQCLIHITCNLCRERVVRQMIGVSSAHV
jgi:hypothetical protein